MQNSQQYLKNKLSSYIRQLKGYELKLLQKKSNNQKLQQAIYLLVQKIQLECYHYEDELAELAENSLPQSRVRHKTSIFIESYEKLVSQINKLILTKQDQHHSDMEYRSDLVSFRKEQPKRLKEMKGFIEELNNSWMLDLLNKNKTKNKKQIKPVKNKQKADTPKSFEEKSPNRKKLGINYLKKEITCLEALVSNLESTYSIHKHLDYQTQIMNLKDQQSCLLKGLAEVKEGNELLKQQYEILQRELLQLKRANEMVSQRYFES